MQRNKSKTGRKSAGKRPPKRINRTNRFVRFQVPEGTKIEYKNFSFLQKFLTERGKVIARRITGITAKQQRELSSEIKKARYLGLISPGPSAKK